MAQQIADSAADSKVLAENGLAIVRLLASQRPRELLVSFQQQLQQKLQRYSEQLDDAQLQAAFAHACTIISDQHSQLLTDVFRYLNQTLEQFSRGTLASSEAAFRSATSLTLMTAEQLEEQAQITALRQRTDSHYQALLWPLCKQFAPLGNGAADPDLNPLSPVRFCLALRYALERAGIVEPMVRKEVFRCFESLFLSRLESFYQQLHDGLAVVGITPDTRFDVVKAQQHSQVENTPPVVEAKPSPALKSQLQPELKQEPLSPTLSAIPNHNASELLQQLAGLLGGGQMALHESHRQVIERVDSVMSEFSRNSRLSGEIKALLGLLHMPLLRVALLDPGFFQQPNHPSRQLLVHMVEAATDWLQGDEKEFGVYQQIGDVVERLLRNPAVGIEHFTEELLQFRHYTRQLQQQLQQQARQRIRLKASKPKGESVEVVLRRHIGGRKLPPAIDQLLHHHWRDYLKSLARELGDRCSKNSRWQDALSVIDDLLWGLQISPKSIDERQRWRQHYLWLEAVLASGLDHLKIDSGHCQQLLTSVRHVYQPLLQDKRQDQPQKQAEVKPLADATSREAVREEIRQTTQPPERILSEEQWLQQLQKIESGSWFCFEHGRREQLVWRNLRTMQFQFCESQGGKSVMRTGRDIARLLSQGTMQLEQDLNTPATELMEQRPAELKQLP